MDLSNLGIVYRVQGRRDEAIALFQRAYTIMSDALGPDDPKTLTVARNLSATQVIEVSVVQSPRAPPAALAQRLSTPRGGRKTSEDISGNLAAATEKRDAVLHARVERAAELRTPRGGQSSSVPTEPPAANGGAAHDISDGPIESTDVAGAAVAGLPSSARPTGADGGSAGPPAMPKLKLNLNPPSSEDAAPATPRSTYSKASAAARAAVADSKAGGKGSARSMLHQHVATFDFGSANSPPPRGADSPPPHS